MGGIPKLEFWDEGILDDLRPSALKREQDLSKGWFDQSEIDGTIPEYKSREADINYMRENFAASVKRLNS